MIATVERYAPGFSSSVIARQIFSPVDLEETFGLTGGDIFHGALGLDQLFSARPLLGYADYRAIDPQEWAGREEEGILLVPHAGEVLYRGEPLLRASGLT